MQLITVIVQIGIVTQNGTICQAESLTGLLTGVHTGHDLNGTITLGKLIGVHICLDSSAELLVRNQVDILDVVSINRGSLGPGRTLGNGSQTIPCDALVINAAGLHRIENAMVTAGFVQALASFIPNDFGHKDIPPYQK